MKPIIAILAEVDSERNTGVRNTYIRAIEQSGGVPVLIPYIDSTEVIEALAEKMDGFLFSGGCDIDPARYGEKRALACGRIESNRDALEFKVFDAVIKKSKPMIGICRGAQLINVALGGTLYQDIPTEVKNHICHEQTEPKDMPSHGVRVFRDTPLFSLTGAERIRANSFHHQAVKKVGNGLSVMAISDDDIIEALYMPEHRYLRAYQWHPERLYLSDECNKKIFDDLVDACRR